MGTKKTLFALTVAAIGCAFIINLATTGAKAIFVGGPSDCKSNSVIPCGAHTTEALIDDFDRSACVQAVFAHFGVSASMVHNLPNTNVAGFVTSDNKVFINSRSEAVATGAVTGGWDNISGSTPVSLCGKTFFQRPPSVSFLQSSLPAFVAMDDGRFSFAVLASCGNVVVATPVHKPKPVVTPTKPTPAPPASTTNIQNNTQIQNQSQSQSQQVVVSPSPTQASTSAQASTPATTSSASTQATTAPLPNTGPGDVIGLFGLTSLAGLIGHRFYLIRRARA